MCSGGETPYKHLDVLSIGKYKPSKRRGARLREIDDGMKIAIKTALIKEQSDFNSVQKWKYLVLSRSAAMLSLMILYTIIHKL